MPSHRLRLVRPREQLLPQARPVHRQIVRQFFHRHPVDAGTALVLPHSLQRGPEVAAFDHQSPSAVARFLSARFRSPPSALPRSVRLVGASPLIHQRELQLPGHLWLGVFETHGRFALLSVRSFAVSFRPSAPAGSLGYYDLC